MAGFSFLDDKGNKKSWEDVNTDIDTGLGDIYDSEGKLVTDYSDLRDSIRRQLAEQYYQQGPDIETFETMLKKLTGSKMQQQGQLAAARRGDIYAGGLANMMSNF